MFLYLTEEQTSGYAGVTHAEAEDKLRKMAENVLKEDPSGSFTVCLVDFEKKTSTIYKFTAEYHFRVTATRY